MQKIPTMFERDWEGDRSRVTAQVHPGCEWVLEGEGRATRKYDGTCVMYDGEKWWARREVKDGKQPPAGFMSSGHDHVTLKNVGWEPIEGSPFAKFHAEALQSVGGFKPGTYELIGPKVQGNPERAEVHLLMSHDAAEVHEVPNRSFAGIWSALSDLDVEGFVFHHEDGRRMAKIKKRDFGLKR
jgi:hypothetical protein